MNKITITLNEHASQLVITIDGELDASNCIIAERQLDKALSTEAPAIFVNCSNLTYISSAGIGVLISLHHSCKKRGSCIIFCELQPKVKNVMEILGLDRLFTIKPTMQDAMASLSVTK
jgi:anti-sigma B factor antagonist